MTAQEIIVKWNVSDRNARRELKRIVTTSSEWTEHEIDSFVAAGILQPVLRGTVDSRGDQKLCVLNLGHEQHPPKGLIYRTDYLHKRNLCDM